MPSKAAQAKAPARKHKYRLQFVPSAWEEWQKLDGSVKEPLRKLLKKRLDNPHVPGAALHGALAGHYKIKLNKQGYRLVYGVQDDVLSVTVMVVDKREARRAGFYSAQLHWSRRWLNNRENTSKLSAYKPTISACPYTLRLWPRRSGNQQRTAPV